MRHSLRVFLTPFVLGLVLYSVPAAADEITVFAAASLTNAMDELGQAFEQKEKVRVRFSFASSSTLAKQIENGAPPIFSCPPIWTGWIIWKSAN